MKLILTLLVTFSFSVAFAQENPASKEINEAIKEMDAGNFSQSRVILEGVLQKDATNYDAWYEYAYSYYMQKDYAKALEIMQAIPYYEKGIEMAPEYPSNYYRLARIYCNSENEIWGVIYGEIFMNLERNTQRTREISALLYQTYQKALVY